MYGGWSWSCPQVVSKKLMRVGQTRVWIVPHSVILIGWSFIPDAGQYQQYPPVIIAALSPLLLLQLLPVHVL